jgi:hypothetical protein
MKVLAIAVCCLLSKAPLADHVRAAVSFAIFLGFGLITRKIIRFLSSPGQFSHKFLNVSFLLGIAIQRTGKALENPLPRKCGKIGLKPENLAIQGGKICRLLVLETRDFSAKG